MNDEDNKVVSMSHAAFSRALDNMGLNIEAYRAMVTTIVGATYEMANQHPGLATALLLDATARSLSLVAAGGDKAGAGREKLINESVASLDMNTRMYIGILDEKLEKARAEAAEKATKH